MMVARKPWHPWETLIFVSVTSDDAIPNPRHAIHFPAN
jgi:hypothetical protein